MKYETYKYLEKDREGRREDPYIYMVFRTQVLDCYGYDLSGFAETKRLHMADFAYRIFPNMGVGGGVQVVKDRTGKSYPGCYIPLKLMEHNIAKFYEELFGKEDSFEKNNFVVTAENCLMITLSSGIIVGEDNGNVVFSFPIQNNSDEFLVIDDLSKAEEFAKAILMFVKRAQKERNK